MKHTAGPWTVESPMGEDTLSIVEAGKQSYQWRIIASVHSDDRDDEKYNNSVHPILIPEMQANARLIAAAPTMLKALADVRQELWVDYCLHAGRTGVDPAAFNARPHIRIIDAALAAATVGAA